LFPLFTLPFIILSLPQAAAYGMVLLYLLFVDKYNSGQDLMRLPAGHILEERGFATPKESAQLSLLLLESPPQAFA
jgi:hypothetical protein